MKNNIMIILPIVLILDLVIPFILAPSYKGYNHLTQVMSVLGNSKAPFHNVYNMWLIVFGITLAVIDFKIYAIISESSKLIAVILFFIVLIYAIGGCIPVSYTHLGQGQGNGCQGEYQGYADPDRLCRTFR